ncbi:MAG: hypothetical protein UU47_C0004G0005 [candidate division TM6 bacterium GW2011_GWE2_41_16]|nr:MAG: hypothetical protein UU47_C0004G0005 [candidate division TM6 bacterium GW2011_GWE2_41_16]
MQKVDTSISLAELEQMSQKMYQQLVKAVIDLEKNIMVVDAEMHVDQEVFLLEEEGSEQDNLWGINLHPDLYGTDSFIEFDSMINMRPSRGNRTRGVDDLAVREKIKKMVINMVKV